MNLLLLFIHEDIMSSIFTTITVLQIFRNLGVMGSSVLPQSMQAIYAKLGFVTLDIEFIQPGCLTLASDFVSRFEANLFVLGLAIAPALVGIFLLLLALRLLAWCDPAGRILQPHRRHSACKCQNPVVYISQGSPP